MPDTRMYETMPRYRSEVLDADWVEIAPCGESRLLSQQVVHVDISMHVCLMMARGQLSLVASIAHTEA
jgi:hypothetical protein